VVGEVYSTLIGEICREVVGHHHGHQAQWNRNATLPPSEREGRNVQADISTREGVARWSAKSRAVSEAWTSS
jgi:hypothetical protein